MALGDGLFDLSGMKEAVYMFAGGWWPAMGCDQQAAWEVTGPKTSPM